jgi:hypothetical protein
MMERESIEKRGFAFLETRGKIGLRQKTWRLAKFQKYLYMKCMVNPLCRKGKRWPESESFPPPSGD